MPLSISSNMKLEKKSLTACMNVSTPLLPDIQWCLHPDRDHDQPDQRHRNEDLPAKPHDLVVPIARERGAEPDEQRDDEEGLEEQPAPAHQPGGQETEFEERERRLPAAEEHDRRERREQDHVRVFGEEEDGE